MTLRRIFAVTVVGLAVFSACGGDGAGSTEVAASDGSATLIIPDGALPDGVEASEITIEPLEPDEVFLDGPFELTMVYDLGPDGLEFSSPAMLEVPVMLPAGHSVLAISLGDSPEWISEVEIEGLPEDGWFGDEPLPVVLRVPVAHFSQLGLLSWGTYGELEVTPDRPGDVEVGETFEPTAAARMLDVFEAHAEFQIESQDRIMRQDVTVTWSGGSWWHLRSTLGATAPLTPTNPVARSIDAGSTVSEHALTADPVECTAVGEFVLNWLVLGSAPYEVAVTMTWDDTGEQIISDSNRVDPAGEDYATVSHRGIINQLVGQGTITGRCSAEGGSATGGTFAGALDGGVTVAVSDPEGDGTPAEALGERGFSLFEDPLPPGMDITDVTVEYGDDQTVITIRFAGSYRELEDDPNRSIGIRPIFQIEGSYGFEIEYRNGQAYLSGAPDGVTMRTPEWLDDRTIRFHVDGHVPMAGDRIRVTVFSYLDAGDDKAVAEDQAAVDIE